jgi:hypothetical protein
LTLCRCRLRRQYLPLAFDTCGSITAAATAAVLTY